MLLFYEWLQLGMVYIRELRNCQKWQKEHEPMKTDGTIAGENGTV
jgi:hypothetical protein